MVWGDSYAMHLVQGFIASKPDIKLVQKTISMCGPFFDIAPISAKSERAGAEKCLSANDKVFEYLKSNPSIKYVVMSSPFLQYVGQNSMVLTKDGGVVPANKIALDSMMETIRRIKDIGKIPIIFSPTPTNGEDIGRCLKKATFFGKDHAICNIDLMDTSKNQGDVWRFLKKIEKTASVVWLTDFLCSDNVCKASFGDKFIYRDTGHLSHEGSVYLGKNMDFYGRLKKAGMEAAQ